MNWAISLKKWKILINFEVFICSFINIDSHVIRAIFRKVLFTCVVQAVKQSTWRPCNIYRKLWRKCSRCKWKNYFPCSTTNSCWTVITRTLKYVVGQTPVDEQNVFKAADELHVTHVYKTTLRWNFICSWHYNDGKESRASAHCNLLIFCSIFTFQACSLK